MIIRFENKKQYGQWLKSESWDVRQKANKFSEKYGDILPIVLVVDAFTPQGGEWAPAYIFLPPEVEELLKWIIA